MRTIRAFKRGLAVVSRLRAEGDYDGALAEVEELRMHESPRFLSNSMQMLRTVLPQCSREKRASRSDEADPLCRVTGPRMNPSVDVGRSPRPFRHLRMAQHRTPDPSSSRAPVHSALVQKSVTRHH